jgi:hypothetical protein
MPTFVDDTSHVLLLFVHRHNLQNTKVAVPEAAEA